MAPYVSSGSLTTNPRSVAVDETWDSTSDWQDNQSASGVDISNGAVTLAQQLPADEGFEHDDLSGTYGGDTAATGAFSIQTNNNDEGTYALRGDASQADNAIVRSTESAWGPPITITARRLIPDNGTAGNGGTMFACDSVSGFSSVSGYLAFVNASGGNDEMSLRRVDSGSVTVLQSDTSAGISTDTWVNEQIDWYSDGTIEWTLNGTTVSASDSTYTDGLLGFGVYNVDIWDDIQFQSL